MKNLPFFVLVTLLLLGAGCAQQQGTEKKDVTPTPVIATSTPQRNLVEDTFSLQDSPDLPRYTFHVTSFTSTTQGKIEIFKDNDLRKPMQVIKLNPNSFLADEIAGSFSIQDINFDGLSDIGVVVDGGAKWASYQYWIYDKKTGRFISAPITKDFGKIGFNEIEFNKEKKQVTTRNFSGVGSLKSVYQFANEHLRLLEEREEQNIVKEGQETAQTSTPALQCEITVKNYVGSSVRVITQVLDHECQPE